MLVLEIEPALPLLEELGLLARPEAILDLSGFGADHLAVRSDHGDLLAPETAFGERAQRGHQMHMRIARIVVIDPVGNLPAAEHLLMDELAHQRDVLLLRQLHREGNDELLGELRVGAFFDGLDLVPERFGGARDRPVGDHLTRPFRRIDGKQEFLVCEIALARIIDGPGLGHMLHLRAVPVGGRQHGATPVSATDDLGREVCDGHGESDPAVERHAFRRQRLFPDGSGRGTSRQRRITAPLEAFLRNAGMISQSVGFADPSFLPGRATRDPGRSSPSPQSEWSRRRRPE